jgi:membrane-associated HD superfamily phosphohydrolase
MHDIVIFVLGLLGVVLFTYNEILKFIKGGFPPNLLNLKMKSNFKLLDFIVNFVVIFAALFINSDYLKGLYVLILSVSILVTMNTLKIRYSRLHKSSLPVIELAVFNTLFILFAAFGGWMAFK